jgi:hypothetical protein
MNDSLITVSGQIKREPQSIRIETPMGAIESDSGNHAIDSITIIIIIAVIYIGKKLIDKYIKK